MSDELMAGIRDHWDAQALNFDLQEAVVTLRDPNQRRLEIDVLLQYLPRNQRILDVGCGTGYSTAIFSRYAASILGIDVSAAMIERARQTHGDLRNVEFLVADILDLKLPRGDFDVVISQRCLINLGTWENQQTAISNIAQVLKPGGMFLLQEGTRQGRARLNETRELLGLESMPRVPFNEDFDETQLWPFLRKYFEIVEVRRFGLYDFVSRVVHPLLVSPGEPEYVSKINEVASLVSSKMRGMDEVAREFSAFLRRLEPGG